MLDYSLEIAIKWRIISHLDGDPHEVKVDIAGVGREVTYDSSLLTLDVGVEAAISMGAYR